MNLTDVLSAALPLDTPYNERCTQLTLAYIDKVRNQAMRKLADSIGENLTTNVRTVGGQSWSYVVLATDTSKGADGAGSGAVGASVATRAVASVKGGGSAASPKGHALDTARPVANMAQAAPVTTPQAAQVSPAQLAKLRARLMRG